MKAACVRTIEERLAKSLLEKVEGSVGASGAASGGIRKEFGREWGSSRRSLPRRPYSSSEPKRG